MYCVPPEVTVTVMGESSVSLPASLPESTDAEAATSSACRAATAAAAASDDDDEAARCCLPAD